jgi:hypothetical protein
VKRYSYLAALGATLLSAPAEACRTPNNPKAALLQLQRQHQESAAQADVIVKGRRFEPREHCDAAHYCGEWIQSVRVQKGSPASYYLIDRDELLLVCSREYVKRGNIGTFHLQAKPNGTYLILDDIR